MSIIYDLGIDVGSTTVKTVILKEGEILYSKYERHFSKVRETVAEQLRIILTCGFEPFSAITAAKTFTFSTPTLPRLPKQAFSRKSFLIDFSTAA